MCNIRCLFVGVLIFCTVTLVFFQFKSNLLSQFNHITFFPERQQVRIDRTKIDGNSAEMLLETRPDDLPEKKLKTILLWNGFDRIEMSIFGLGHEPFIKNSCPVSNCIMMASNSSAIPVEEVDAVVFNMPLIVHLKVPEDKLFPTKRTPKQRYVYFSQESPFYTVKDLDRYRGFFNWTMS